MKKLVLSLMALVSLSQADMSVEKWYTCSNERIQTSIDFRVVDGGSIAMLNEILLFNVSVGMYTGVGTNGDKLVVMTYPVKDTIKIAFENIVPMEFKCVETIEVAKGE